MARCPDCNKFVGYDMDTEPEVEDMQVFDDEVAVNVRVVLACSECGTELKESYQEAQETIDHTCETEAEEDKVLPDDEERYEVEDSSATFHERYEDKTKTGKPIKNPRYMKKFYGAEVSVSIKCNHCGETFDQMITTEEQASSFDEC